MGFPPPPPGGKKTYCVNLKQPQAFIELFNQLRVTLSTLGYFTRHHVPQIQSLINHDQVSSNTTNSWKKTIFATCSSISLNIKQISCLTNAKFHAKNSCSTLYHGTWKRISLKISKRSRKAPLWTVFQPHFFLFVFFCFVTFHVIYWKKPEN